MKLSTRAVYGVRAMFDLAYHGGQRPLQTREIAEREAIPERFLEQILGDLKRAGLVVSKRGPKGGFLLEKSPDDITLAAIFDALDAAPQMPASPSCPEEGPDNQGAAGQPREEAPGSWEVADRFCEALLERMRRELLGATLADVVRRGEVSGVGRESYEGFVYVI